MAQQADRPNAFDPFGAWKQARDVNLEAWSKAMIEFVNSDAYAKASGQMLDQYLAASRPFQQMLERVMTAALMALNMPNRAEVASLAERLTNLEIRLDDMDVKLDQIEALLQQVLERVTGPAAPTAEGR